MCGLKDLTGFVGFKNFLLTKTVIRSEEVHGPLCVFYSLLLDLQFVHSLKVCLVGRLTHNV